VIIAWGQAEYVNLKKEDGWMDGWMDESMKKATSMVTSLDVETMMQKPCTDASSARRKRENQGAT
jgi:hypothetical protein